MSPRVSRRTLGRLGIAAGLGAVGIGGAAVESRREVGTTRLARLDLTSGRITGRPFRVLQISDLHDMADAEQRNSILQMARQLRPDLIAVTGDLVSLFTKDLSRMDDFLGRLVALGIPVRYVPGNHEHDSPLFDDIMTMVRSHLDVPLNQATAFDGAWGRLDLVCVDDYYTGNGDLGAAMSTVRPGTYRLVLTHSPQVADDLSRADVDLAMCGHTHGGQVRLPVLGAIYTPGGGRPFPRLDKGLFQAGRAQLYIDSGAGQSLDLRLNDPSQVTLATVARG